MPLYNSHSINIYRYGTSLTTTTSYGKPKTNILTLQSNVNGDFQPLDANESVKAFGVVTQGGFEVYLDLDVDIQANDIVTINDNLQQYKVFGDPQEYTTIQNYQLATLKREGHIIPITED